MDHGPCADFDAVSDPDAAHHHGSGPNQAVSANLRGLSLHLTNGDVLINPAAGTNSGITGDVDAVKAVG
ncbi:MAG: hypothetical protein ACLSHU_02120 [Oscillospiraceae bacterium]